MSEQKKLVPYILVGPTILEQRDVDSINNLMQQLSGGGAAEVQRSTLTTILCQPNCRMIIFQHPETREIISMASLYYYKTLYAPRGVGRVEDVVVDKRFRGQGLGKLIMKYLISLAKSLRLEALELTSNPTRIEANKMYLELGFQKYDTNCYTMDL